MKKIITWAFSLFLLVAQPVSAQVIDVTLHYVGPTEGLVWMGVQQGIDEANLQGEFLGQKYTIEVVSSDELSAIENVTAVLVAEDAETVMSVANMSALANVPVLNLESDADALRAICLPNLLNIPASQKMKQDALAQWLAKNPDSTAHTQGWHEDFKKFAASQLNKRFTKAHGVKMDNHAWSGWAAVKLLSDTVARTHSADAATMLSYLKNDIAFDGQKGAGATFRATGQLRQLVLIVSDQNKILAEAPLRGAKGGLDSLGLATCK
jgi:ABC-type branched-subunit amino acid transport system substrate-binding protein